ncbi:hypothetical protein [Halobellus sp. EA9]|uniref:hypothetical protein n=1 Tax=Halobellus sp. EA9 TaxID=3421647 RepID=UPI003EB755BD
MPDTDEYRDILLTHVDAAFTSDGITDTAVDAVHEYCAGVEHIGTALDILRRAGETAAAAGADTVTEAHVQAQLDDSSRPVDLPSDA